MEDFKDMIMKKSLVEKMYLVGFVIAIISLFFTWVDAIGIVKAGGFQQGGYLFLILMLYPIITMFMGKARHYILGIVLAGINLLGIIMFINSKSVDWFGDSINMASTGMYIMAVATIIILVGAIMEFMNNKKAKETL
ncbi:MAG: hypothetical protein ACRC28_03555 [Clostridium sp.]|uniref:hypothetical protein n=1 Tax=Clostridium sp. TaxID=1506 RepID=UPI003F3824CE